MAVLTCLPPLFSSTGTCWLPFLRCHFHNSSSHLLRNFLFFFVWSSPRLFHAFLYFVRFSALSSFIPASLVSLHQYCTVFPRYVPFSVLFSLPWSQCYFFHYRFIQHSENMAQSFQGSYFDLSSHRFDLKLFLNDGWRAGSHTGVEQHRRFDYCMKYNWSYIVSAAIGLTSIPSFDPLALALFLVTFFS